MSKASQGMNAGLTLVILVGCLTVFLMPSIFALLAVGMAPTWVAALAERHHASRLHTTAALNFAGVVPFLGQIWSTGGGLTAVMDLLSNVFTWAVMYGSAAIGVAFLWMGPQIAALYLDLKSAHYTRQLRKQRKHLLEEWGSGLDDSPEEEEEPADGAHGAAAPSPARR